MPEEGEDSDERDEPLDRPNIAGFFERTKHASGEALQKRLSN